MITIVDYGLGNLGSIANMLERLGISSRITQDKAEIAAAEKIILPGVGAFDNGMCNLRKLGFIDVLNQRVMQQRIPVLGICLGAQLMTSGSEEGREHGLDWIDADTVRFQTDSLKVPHMGWNDVTVRKPSPLLTEKEEARFYFVHSYHFSCKRSEDILATSTYGYDFTAAFSRDNIYGVQFHPEKSHKFGMGLLRRFAAV